MAILFFAWPMTDQDISHIAGRYRHIPPILIQRARELRQRQTPAKTRSTATRLSTLG